jgi:hypothetical protein
MRTIGNVLTLVLAGILGSGSAGCAVEEGDDGGAGCEGGKCDGFNVEWSSRIQNIVPEDVHNYLEKYQWGDYHLFFHMSRRWFIAGDRTRQWLDSLNESYADLQEGDPGGGVEFLAMHRAMIEHLDGKFGDVGVPDSIRDGAGFETMGEVLRGWDTDEKMIAQLERVGGDVERFRTAAAKVREYDAFVSEDDFGGFLQTTLLLSRMVDENDTERRYYDQDTREGAGIHNQLHGMFSDGSECDVGDPQRNLSNQMFWGIHGWVEARWQEFEQNHVRTPAEQAELDHQLERFRLHMQLHSDFHEEHRDQLPKAPPALVDEIVTGDKAFRNGADCDDLDSTVDMPDCT